MLNMNLCWQSAADTNECDDDDDDDDDDEEA
jgi:hypothetical protein